MSDMASDMADYYFELHEREMLCEIAQLKRELRGPRVIWVTKDCQEIPIEKMATSHIKNSINRCKRRNWRMEFVPYLESELRRRGESI